MKRVSEHDFRANGFEILGRHRLHGSIGSDRHECRRLDRAARECQAAPPRRPVLREQIELHRAHATSLALREGVRNIASP